MDSATNSTATPVKVLATTEGMTVAYGGLLFMAVLPVLIGSLRSIKFHKTKILEKLDDRLTSKDAAMFPFFASGILLVIYTVFKIFSKEAINALITGYFYLLGVLALCHLLSPLISKLIPVSVKNASYHLMFTEKLEEKAINCLADYKFSRHDIISFIVCCVFGFWYLIKKHWIVNNMFGMAFAINGIEMLQLNKVSTAFILLCGLFVYDVFWVFYTDVMVTVAKLFDAPIKLVFPQDFLENGIYGTNFAMLGLGDIVIPGIFAALLLRFDKSLNREKNVYFMAAVFSYVFGLMTTIVVLHIFKHAQPALLYLVPSCIIIPLSVALLKGDLKALFNYEDYPDELVGNPEKVEKSNSSQENSASSTTPSESEKKKI